MAVKDLVFLPDRRPSGPETPLIFVFDTSLGLTAAIPFIGAHNVTIDWGDGMVQAFVGAADAIRSRAYASAGTFTVLVTGAAVGIGGLVVRPNLIACTQWGDIGDTMTSASRMFRSCANLTTVPAVAPASVTNMSYMFYGATSFNQPLGSWDVSSVTNMSSMFRSATSFNQNLSPWVTGLTAQPTLFSNGANATFANNANLLKPFLSGGVTRINT